MIRNNSYILGAMFFVLWSIVEQVQAGTQSLIRGLYIGAIGGYGSTTWDGLVPSGRNRLLALTLSTPISVEEGGVVSGAVVGYEFNPFFALEANYLKYPDAKVSFDAFSIFALDHEGLTDFISSSESYNIMAKVMMLIPKTKIKFFSSAGIANLHREDILLDDWRVTPTFSLGFVYPLTEHIITELSGNYTAGFGESQLNPVETYYPFLYSATFRFAYLF